MTTTVKADDQLLVPVGPTVVAGGLVATAGTGSVDFDAVRPFLSSVPLRRSGRVGAGLDARDPLAREMDAWDAASAEALANFEGELPG